MTPPARTVVVPWYSARLYARLRRDLVDGAACLRWSHEQWCEMTAGEIEALQHKGWVVIRVDADVEELEAYLAARWEEPDYGGWRSWLLAAARRR